MEWLKFYDGEREVTLLRKAIVGIIVDPREGQESMILLEDGRIVDLFNPDLAKAVGNAAAIGPITYIKAP